MAVSSGKGFYEEMARLMPGLLRAIAVRQGNIIARGNIAISHIVVVDVLSERGACTMGELAKELNFTMSAVTSIVDKMIEHRLVKRDRDTKDRRIVRVSLISGGKEVEQRIHDFRKRISEDLFSVLSSSEKKAYLSMIKKVYLNITEKKDDKACK
jgi:MarR family transcriptional regulator, organic hydroperoxide resistance regulator